MTPDIIAALEGMVAIAQTWEALDGRKNIQLENSDAYQAALAALSTSPAGQEVLHSEADHWPTCEACAKVILPGQFVHTYAEGTEVHVDCDRPYATPTDPTAMFLIGDPMRLVPAVRCANIDRAGNEIAARLCDWNNAGEKPMPLMQEAARFIRSLIHPSYSSAAPSVEPAGNGREAVENAFIAGWEAQKAGRSFAAAMNDHIPALSSPPAAEQEAVDWSAEGIANLHMLAVGASLESVKERKRYVARLARDIEAFGNLRAFNARHATTPAPALGGVREALVARIEQIERALMHGDDEEAMALTDLSDIRPLPRKNEAVRLALEDADGLERTAEEVDENGWQDWGGQMRQAAMRIRDLAALSTPLSHDAEGESATVSREGNIDG